MFVWVVIISRAAPFLPSQPGVQFFDLPKTNDAFPAFYGPSSPSPTWEKFVIATSPSGNSAMIFNFPPTASM